MMARLGNGHIRAMRAICLLLPAVLIGCDASAPETVLDVQTEVTCSPSDYQDWLAWAPDEDGDPRPRPTLQCLPRELERDAEGFVDCVVIEVRGEGDPACSDPGRRPVAAEHLELLDIVLGADSVDPAWTTVCEVEQLGGDARSRCEQDWPNPADAGFCYLSNDATHVGDAELIDACGFQPPQALRFTGDTVAPGGLTFIACNERQSECQ